MKRPPRLPFPGLAGLGAGAHPLPEAARHHLVTVLRARPGAKVLVFDPDAGVEAAGVLASAGGDVLLEAPQDARAPSGASAGDARPLLWLHGLPKAKKADALVQDATELGATEVHLFRAARSVVALDGERAEKRAQRLAAIAEDAARQCGRARAPTVRVHDGLDAALAALPEATRLFVLVPGAAHPLGPALAEALAAPRTPLAFVVGPEGGLTDEEIARALVGGTAASAPAAVSFGETVLRTETVPAAVLGAVRALVAAFGPAATPLPPGPCPQ